MKRILIFSLAYHPYVGGAEIAIREITNRVSDVAFELITLRMGAEPREERVGNVFVHRVGHGRSYFQKVLFIPCAAAAAARLHRARPFDAFWAMMSYMLFPIVLLRMRGVRLPYLLTLQEGDPWEHMFTRWFIRPFLPFLRSGFRHATHVQTISTYLAEWAKRMGYRGNPTVIPNGVDVAHFVGEPVPHEGVVLVTTSRLVHKNAIDDVVRALALLPAHITFTILGTGPDERILKDLAKRLGVEERVRFMGYVPHSEMPSYLHQSDLFIRPSRSEGMGNSFIEAMAAGLPTIGTNVGGIPDFLHAGETGWVVEPDSPEQIAAAVRAILSSPDQAARVTENAKHMVIEKYDWNLVAREMKKVFDNAVDKSAH